MKKLFTNVAITNTKETEVKTFLRNLKNILRWSPDVTEVGEEGTALTVVRTGAALNPTETITVETNDAQVVYHSTNGRLVYDLIFALTAESAKTRIEMTLLYDEQSAKGLPIKLLTPIAKHAFNQSLTRIAELVAYDQ